MDVGDLGIGFIACFTRLGVRRPGFLPLDSAMDFLNNPSELYRPTFQAWQPGVQCTDSRSAPGLAVGIPPTTYRACFVNGEAGPNSASLHFPNCC